jgi:hypothetical protein
MVAGFAVTVNVVQPANPWNIIHSTSVSHYAPGPRAFSLRRPVATGAVARRAPSSMDGNAGARIGILQALQLARHSAAHPCPGSAIRARFLASGVALAPRCAHLHSRSPPLPRSHAPTVPPLPRSHRPAVPPPTDLPARRQDTRYSGASRGILRRSSANVAGSRGDSRRGIPAEGRPRPG